MNSRIFHLLFLFLPAFLSAQLVGDTENGLASYYSAEYNGAETSYNVIYDKTKLVAAHRQFPFNSTVEVKNMENGKSVTVRIIDKGPFIRSRIIELSERAAAAIGLLGKETVPVELTLLSVPGQTARISAPETPVPNTPVVEASPDPTPRPVESTTTPSTYEPETIEPQPTTAPTRAAQPQPGPQPTVPGAASRAEVKATPVSANVDITRQATFAPGVYKIELSDIPSGKHGVQVGSFKDLDRAMDKVTELQSKWFDNVLIQRVGTGAASVYKIILGPFDSDKSALRYASDLKKRYKIAGFTVTLD